MKQMATVKVHDSQRDGREKKRFTLPHLGMRIVKTSVAVFLCLMIYILRGYRGMVSQSVIAAIICMQPFVSDSKTFAQDRVLGTLLGALCGLVYLLLMDYVVFPLCQNMVLVFALMSLGVLFTFYLMVVVRMADSAGLAAIVFLCVVLTYPDVEAPLMQSIDRVFDTFIGTVVAIAVNLAHLPREKHPEQLIFLRSKYLVPDRYSQIPSAVLIALNRFYNDGARICLMSEYAPAFFISQMGTVRVSTPIIVMDGAALYDTAEKAYPETIPIPQNLAASVREILDRARHSYSVYTIRDNSMFTYRFGESNPEEQKVYERLKRSPYRNYLTGEYAPEDKVVYFKIIDNKGMIRSLEHHLQRRFTGLPLRIVKRQQAGFEDVWSLYIYSEDATMENMKQRLVKHVEGGERMTQVEITPNSHNYSPERDVLHLLNKVRDTYEPVKLPWRRRRS